MGSRASQLPESDVWPELNALIEFDAKKTVTSPKVLPRSGTAGGEGDRSNWIWSWTLDLISNTVRTGVDWLTVSTIQVNEGHQVLVPIWRCGQPDTLTRFHHHPEWIRVISSLFREPGGYPIATSQLAFEECPAALVHNRGGLEQKANCAIEVKIYRWMLGVAARTAVLEEL